MSTENIIELALDDSHKATIYLHGKKQTKQKLNQMVLVLKYMVSLKYLYFFKGATLTSWINNKKEMIFVSKESVFDNKKAIRGGIPIVFRKHIDFFDD